MYSSLKNAVMEAKDLVDSLLKRSEILEKESELRVEGSLGSTSSAYRFVQRVLQ